MLKLTSRFLLFLGFIILVLFDSITFLLCMQFGNILDEANPVIRYSYMNYGFYGIIALKVLIYLLFFIVYEWYLKKDNVTKHVVWMPIAIGFVGASFNIAYILLMVRCA